MSIQFEDVVGEIISAAPAGSLPPAPPAESESSRTRAVLRAIEREQWRCARLDDR